jgi:hypothetical protein
MRGSPIVESWKENLYLHVCHDHHRLSFHMYHCKFIMIFNTPRRAYLRKFLRMRSGLGPTIILAARSEGTREMRKAVNHQVRELEREATSLMRALESGSPPLSYARYVCSGGLGLLLSHSYCIITLSDQPLKF